MKCNYGNTAAIRRSLSYITAVDRSLQPGSIGLASPPPPTVTCVFGRYMVERRWYEQWKQFVETGDQNSSSFPGQIDNTELFDGQLLLLLLFWG